MLLTELGNVEDAVKAAKISLNLYPSVEGYYRLGIGLYCLNEYSAALEVFSIGYNLDVSSNKLKKAINTTIFRISSRKDRKSLIP